MSNLKNVLTIESMMVGGTAYARLTEVAPEILEQIEKSLGAPLPLDQILGVWVKIDEQVIDQYKEAGEEEGLPTTLELQAFYESVKPFFVLKSVEKQYTEKGERLTGLSPNALSRHCEERRDEAIS